MGRLCCKGKYMKPKTNVANGGDVHWLPLEMQQTLLFFFPVKELYGLQ